MKSTPVVHKARKSKAAVRSLDSVLVSGIDDDSSYETRTSLSGTPKGKAANDTWLTVQSLAPVDYPAEYHGLLTSLPQVQSIKPSNWLEIGVEAEGVDRLPEPDRIIAAAMSWNAEDYAQTKCTFFNQYDATITNRHHWLNTLRFGGSRSKEKGERLLAMWDALGWLEPSATVASDPHSNAVTSDSTELRQPSLYGHSWSEEEKNAVAKIMRNIETDESCTNMGLLERAKRCSERLSAEYGHHRTEKAVRTQWKKMQELVDTNAIQEDIQAGHDYRPVCDNLVPEENEDLNEVVEGKRASSWTSREEEAMLGIMDALEKHPDHKDATIKQRAEICKLRLKSRFGTDRTSVAITVRYHKTRREREAVQVENTTQASAIDSAINGDIPSILKTPLTVAVANDGRTEDSNLNASSAVGKIRWSDQEDKALLGILKEIEEDPSLSILGEREKFKVCSMRLISRYDIRRTPDSIGGCWKRLSSTSTLKRKGDDIGGSNDMGRKKRKQGESRFVAELFNAGEE